MHRALAATHASIAELDRLRRSGMRIDAVDENGLTCLYVAAAGGEAEVVDWLLSRGADAAVVNPEDGRTPLHAASAAGHVAVAALLVRAGANSLARDGSGLTPPELAQRSMHLDVVRAFLEHSRNEQKAAKAAERVVYTY